MARLNTDDLTFFRNTLIGEITMQELRFNGWVPKHGVEVVSHVTGKVVFFEHTNVEITDGEIVSWIFAPQKSDLDKIDPKHKGLTLKLFND